MMNNQLRRKKLLDKIPNRSIVILSSGKEIFCSEDANYPYYPNRNFFYLSNISQSDSYLVLLKNGTISEYLYITDFDEKKEKWFGRLLKTAEAKELSRINEVKTTSNFSHDLKEFLKSVDNVYLDFKTNNDFFNDFKISFPKLVINNIYGELVNLRMRKDIDEINNIKEAIKITHLGLKRVIKELAHSQNEFEIYNAFNHEVLNHGTHEIGFPSIIASGVNTCCLHYPTPYSKLASNGLILCDVGASYNHYSSDVTRTYPINGKFTDEQKTIYQIVLDTNKKVIEAIRPGVFIKDLQELAKKTLAEGCIKNHLINNEADLINYYFHGVSHHIGLDVHDASDKNQVLEEGMVITVEPGLYFKDKAIGIRIEDDILVTKNGHEVLTKAIEKEINDIENLF